MKATKVISQFELGVAGYYCSSFLMVHFVSSICKFLWKRIVCSVKGVWSKTFFMQQGIIRKEVSQKKEHTGTQT